MLEVRHEIISVGKKKGAEYGDKALVVSSFVAGLCRAAGKDVYLEWMFSWQRRVSGIIGISRLRLVFTSFFSP